METLFILMLFLVVVAAAAPGVYAPLEIWRVLHRRGLGDADPSVETCHEWLASGKREGLEGFCPNAAYIEKLERK